MSIGCLSRLDEPEFVETLIRYFAAQAGAKKLTESKARWDENELIDQVTVNKASPVVVLGKSNGDFRICGDY